MTGPTLQDCTEAHYDGHPFDALTAEDEANPRQAQPRPFLEFCDTYLKTPAIVAEVGCGPGRGTMYLIQKGHTVTAVDISEGSIARAQRRAPQATFVRATNLSLPFDDCSFDAVVSDGVIHHTPDAFRSLTENARILRPGGHLYLGVYNRSRLYYYIYTYAGPPIRWIEKFTSGRALLNFTVIPLYYLAHLVKSRGKRTWVGAKNFFYDYIVTPQATFHSRSEVEAWGVRLGLDILAYDPSLGNVHVFVFSKRPATAGDCQARPPETQSPHAMR